MTEKEERKKGGRKKAVLKLWPASTWRPCTSAGPHPAFVAPGWKLTTGICNKPPVVLVPVGPEVVLGKSPVSSELEGISSDAFIYLLWNVDLESFLEFWFHEWCILGGRALKSLDGLPPPFYPPQWGSRLLLSLGWKSSLILWVLLWSGSWACVWCA